MLKQIKKTLAVLLAVCFLATVTAGAVSAHVFEVGFELPTDINKLIVGFRNLISKSINKVRSSDACNNIFALCINKVLSEEFPFSCRRVSCKSNSCA